MFDNHTTTFWDFANAHPFAACVMAFFLAAASESIIIGAARAAFDRKGGDK